MCDAQRVETPPSAMVPPRSARTAGTPGSRSRTAQEPSHETARSRARSRPPYYKFSSVMCATTPSFKMIPNSHVRKGTRGAVCRLPIRTIPDMRSQTKG